MIRVVIPYGGTDPHRQRSLTWVWENVATLLPDATIHVGTCPGPWSKAVAVDDAMDQNWPDDDILVIHDADVWIPELGKAIEVVQGKARQWAVPHTLVVRMGDELSGRVMSGELGFTGLGRHGLDQPPYQGVVGGGCVVLSRAAYRQVPLDPRFRGWGQEDESWGFALRRILGQPYQGQGKLYHFWHPHPERLSRAVGSLEGDKLRNRYRAAQVAREEMERLLDEFRSM